MKPKARVAVRDRLPLYRHGVTAALASEGILVDTPADLMAWASEGGCRVVIVTLEDRSDWTVLEQLNRARPRPLVIATLSEDPVSASISALRLGADSVISRSASVKTLRRALDGVLAGESLVATSVVRSLVSPVSSVPDESGSARAERVEWVRQECGEE
jgi:DNA-binding NarL/FixJ family response regulator